MSMGPDETVTVATKADDPVLPLGLKLGVRRSYFTPLEVIGRGGMGRLLKVQLHRDDFVVPYVLSHVMSGSLSPAIIGIYGRYQLDDPEFEAEVSRRVATVDRSSFLFHRMVAELESREAKIFKSGGIAAVKIPHHDDGQHTRFLRETRALHNMGDHPNIVKYICCDVIDQRPVLIMEYFPSADLADTLKMTKMPAEWALNAFLSILKALHHAHHLGIIHRDVKPANILTDGQVIKVTDFGLAKPISSAESSVTLADQIVGTPSYMAPEQINPRLGDIGEETDMYQLGLTLFEMATRRMMYDKREYQTRLEKMGGVALRESDTVRLILDDVEDFGKDHPHFPRDFEPSLPDEFEKLIMTCCQKAKLERYTCELAMEHAQELLDQKVFKHADPFRPPSEDRKRESRATLIFASREAMLARHAYDEAEAYERCVAQVNLAVAETDLIGRADALELASNWLRRLPRAKFPDVHCQFEEMAHELASGKDDIDAFRPNRKIALEISEAYENLISLIDGENFYEIPAGEIRSKASSLRSRAEQHLERIRRTCLPDRLVGKYLQMMEAVIAELPQVEASLSARKASFIRKKRDELDSALLRNPNEAALLLLILRRALENAEPDEEWRAIMALVESTYAPKLALDGN